MPLPSLVSPEFNITLPSNKKDITYRPFTVKEQKALLIAKESNEPKEVINITQKVVAECCDIPLEEVQKMPYFDIEWIFLHIRSKSIGEDFKFIMSNGEGSECDASTEVTFALEDIKFELDKSQSNDIKISDDIGITFEYPNFFDMGTFSDISNPMVMYNFIVAKMKTVWDNDRVYDDFTKTEAEKFIDSLNTDQYSKILRWFNNIPVLTHKFKWTCKVCKKESEMILTGLNDFFL